MFNKVDFVIVLLELKNSIAFWDQYVKQNKVIVTYWKFSINSWFLNTKLILYILFSWKLARWYTYGSGRILLILGSNVKVTMTRPVLQIVSLCFLPQVFTKTEEVITKLEQKNHIDILCMIGRSKVKITELESLHQQLVLRQ